MDLKKQFIDVMDSMVRVGWLKSHIFTAGKGHHLVWNPEGGAKAAFLKIIAEKSGLADDDRGPVSFDILCRKQGLPAGTTALGEVDPEVAALWIELVDELGYAGDEDRLLVMVHIACGWAPDGETGLRFGSD